jgi:hypothetical protein
MPDNKDLGTITHIWGDWKGGLPDLSEGWSCTFGGAGVNIGINSKEFEEYLEQFQQKQEGCERLK